MLLASVAAAHADPGLRLTESTATPGDTVHFTISDAEDVKSYSIEIAGRPVTQGGNRGREKISGTFTMPDLGGPTRAVAVDATLTEPDETFKVSRSLQYVGAVQPATAAPVAAAPEPAQAVVQPAPAPTSTSVPDAPPAYEPPHSERPSKPAVSGRRAPKRRVHVRQAGTPTTVEHTRRRAARKRPRKRRAPRTAPLFDGIPESSGGRAGAGGPPSLNSIVPPTAFLTAAPAGGSEDGGLTAAVLVPAVLGFVALLLAATALLRNRRLRLVGGRTADPRLAAFTRIARSGSHLRRGIRRGGGKNG